MTIAPPTRLRADSALPEALREALRELPNDAPAPAQLDELRQRLGLPALSAETPVPSSAGLGRRQKERRLRRTVVALLFFPVAATAAAGGAIALTERFAATTASTATAGALSPAHLTQGSGPSSAPPVGTLESPSAPDAAPSAAARVGAGSSTALVVAHSEPSATDDQRSATGQTEVELLQRANAALKSDPARALALAEQHRHRFPQGDLGQEREVIAIKALLALGDSERAKDGLTRFERAYPRSVHALELRQIVH